MFNKTTMSYKAPECEVFEVEAEVALAASGNSTTPFGDGGSLPGWGGNSTTPFGDGGVLPGF